MTKVIAQAILFLLTFAVGVGGISSRQLRAEEYPRPPSKKGLQVQMVDDALELGIHHAAINLNLGQLLQPTPTRSSLAWTIDGVTYHFNSNYLAQMDKTVKSLSDHGVVVSIIVLNYEPSDAALRRILLHPNYSPQAPNRLSAFNNRSEEGQLWLRAALEFLSHRWSQPGEPNGRVWNWIIGNEVNSHWFWYNMGEVSLQELASDYAEALKIACRAILGQQPDARVFVSLDHHWNISYPGGSTGQVEAGRKLLELLAEKTSFHPSDGAENQTNGNWHVAYHPYPENLFEPRSWLDQSVTDDWETSPRITFKNIEQLARFLKRPEMLYGGELRRIILSEQGFHTLDGEKGEIVQAAAFCYAWAQVNSVPEIDAFILHRHVDHAQEGGLRLGLWTRTDDSISKPERKKKIWQVFQAAGDKNEEVEFEFAADWFSSAE